MDIYHYVHVSLSLQIAENSEPLFIYVRILLLNQRLDI